MFRTEYYQSETGVAVFVFNSGKLPDRKYATDLSENDVIFVQKSDFTRQKLEYCDAII